MPLGETPDVDPEPARGGRGILPQPRTDHAGAQCQAGVVDSVRGSASQSGRHCSRLVRRNKRQGHHCDARRSARNEAHVGRASGASHWRPGSQAEAISSVTLKTIGIGRIRARGSHRRLGCQTNPIVATYAKDDGVHVRVVGIADDEESARAIRDDAASEVSQRLHRWLYGEDEVSLAGAIASQFGVGWTSKLRIVDHGGGGQFGAHDAWRSGWCSGDARSNRAAVRRTSPPPISRRDCQRRTILRFLASESP